MSLFYSSEGCNNPSYSINLKKALVEPMTQDPIEALDANIKQAQKIVDVADALERLKTNRDFKKVILEGYFEQEAVRLVHLKADSNMQSDASQKSILSQMDAIGGLNQFFETTFYKANQAKRAIEADEETRAEILAEGNE